MNTQQQAAAAETKWWDGTNFWVAALVFIGSLWGISHEEIAPAVSAVVGIAGTVFAFRERIKSTVVNWGQWIKSANTWNYLVAVLAAVIPNVPAGLGDRLSDVVGAIAGKNWANLITALFSLGTVIFFWATGGKGLFSAKK